MTREELELFYELLQKRIEASKFLLNSSKNLTNHPRIKKGLAQAERIKNNLERLI